MKATELRIGNYFEDIDGNHCQVTLLTFRQLHGSPTAINLIKPIPLTEEWLLKFGFIKSVVFYMKGAMNIEFIDNGCLFGLDGEYEVFIQHVHQLQNLYFALTNEEL